jgi:hypothetical protein
MPAARCRRSQVVKRWTAAMSLRCFFHGHETLLDRDAKGVLWLVCACGYRQEAIHRSARERQVMQKKFRKVAPQKAQRQTDEKIVRFK